MSSWVFFILFSLFLFTQALTLKGESYCRRFFDLTNGTLIHIKTNNTEWEEDECKNIRIFYVENKPEFDDGYIVLTSIVGKQVLYGIPYEEALNKSLSGINDILQLISYDLLDSAIKIGKVSILNLDFKVEFESDKKMISPVVYCFTDECEYYISFYHKSNDSYIHLIQGAPVNFFLGVNDKLKYTKCIFDLDEQDIDNENLIISLLSLSGNSHIEQITCKNSPKQIEIQERYSNYQKEMILIKTNECRQILVDVDYYKESSFFSISVVSESKYFESNYKLGAGLTTIEEILANTTQIISIKDENKMVFISSIVCQLRVESENQIYTGKNIQFLSSENSTNFKVSIDSFDVKGEHSHCGIFMYYNSSLPNVLIEGVKYPIIFNEQFDEIYYSYIFYYDSYFSFVLVQITVSTTITSELDESNYLSVYVYYDNQKNSDRIEYKIFDLNTKIIMNKDTKTYCQMNKLCSLKIKIQKKFKNGSKKIYLSVQSSTDVIINSQSNSLSLNSLANSKMKNLCFDMNADDEGEFGVNFKLSWGTVKILDLCYNNYNDTKSQRELLEILNEPKNITIEEANIMSLKHFIKKRESCPRGRLLCASISEGEQHNVKTSPNFVIIDFDYYLKTHSAISIHLGQRVNGNFYRKKKDKYFKLETMIDGKPLKEPTSSPTNEQSFSTIIQSNQSKIQFYIYGINVNVLVKVRNSNESIVDDHNLNGVYVYDISEENWSNITENEIKIDIKVYIDTTEDESDVDSQYVYPYFCFYLSSYEKGEVIEKVYPGRQLLCRSGFSPKNCYYLLQIDNYDIPQFFYLQFDPEKILVKNQYASYDILIINIKYLKSSSSNLIYENCKNISKTECRYETNLTDSTFFLGSEFFESKENYIVLVKASIYIQNYSMKLLISKDNSLKESYIEPFFSNFFYIPPKTQRDFIISRPENLSNTNYSYHIRIEKNQKYKGLLTFADQRFYLEGSMTYVLKNLENKNRISFTSLDNGIIIRIQFQIQKDNLILHELDMEWQFGLVPEILNTKMKFYANAKEINRIDMNMQFKQIVFQPEALHESLKIDISGYFITKEELEFVKKGNTTFLSNRKKEHCESVGQDLINLLTFERGKEDENCSYIFFQVELKDEHKHIMNNHMFAIYSIANDTLKAPLINNLYFISFIKERMYMYLDMEKEIKGTKELYLSLSLCDTEEMNISLLYKNKTVFLEKLFETKDKTNYEAKVPIEDGTDYLILYLSNKNDEKSLRYYSLKYSIHFANESMIEYPFSDEINKEFDLSSKKIYLNWEPFRNISRSNVIIKSIYYVKVFLPDEDGNFYNKKKEDKKNSICVNFFNSNHSVISKRTLDHHFNVNNIFDSKKIQFVVLSKFSDYKGEEFIFSYSMVELDTLFESYALLYLTIGIFVFGIVVYLIYMIVRRRRAARKALKRIQEDEDNDNVEIPLDGEEDKKSK